MTDAQWQWFSVGMFAFGVLAGACFGVMWGIRARAAAFVEGLEQAKAIYTKRLEEERAAHVREQQFLASHPSPDVLVRALRALPLEPPAPIYPCAHGCLPAPCKVCAPWLRGIADMPAAKQ